MEEIRTETTDAELVERLRAAHKELMDEASKVVFGQTETLEMLLVSILCKGHSLLLGLPGLGKTLMANTLAQMLDLDFCRIQFTPDLMPSDITGTDVIEEDPETGRRHQHFLKGPIFANFVLADEINRTPPKTQAALLQAMQEKNVTIGRQTYKLEAPFMVLATENPIEMEGTYVLPEAQLDRFMFCLKVAYPSVKDEVEIVKNTTGAKLTQVGKVMGKEELLKLQDIVRGVPIADEVVLYAVRLVNATRVENGAESDVPMVRKYVSHGASPRASQYLVLGAKALALLNGRFHVSTEDIRKVAGSVMRHRLVLNFKSKADGVSGDDVIKEVIANIKSV
ncbi:ATPase AAA [Fulvitalea axinellae]|uniref:ATPase AAA n=1 Tax=Fulvitalea axinellae TaxID=1182444 RepID=A0AAU9D3Z9_9BACT|nr:ATPase AAA [Fulvitalea axinellae]